MSLAIGGGWQIAGGWALLGGTPSGSYITTISGFYITTLAGDKFITN
jgi:hypothetical protein